jgi:hypothetical protein
MTAGARPVVAARVLHRDGALSTLRIEVMRGDFRHLGAAGGGSARRAPAMRADIEPGDRRSGGAFGTGSDPVAASHDAETAGVSMPPFDPDEGRVDVVQDGRTVQRRARGQQPSAASPSEPPAAWPGRHPGEIFPGKSFPGEIFPGKSFPGGMFPGGIFRASDRRAALVAPMGEATSAEAQDIIGIGSPFEVAVGWILGQGCQPHRCDVARGAVAIDPSDGRLVEGLWTQGGAPLRGGPRRPLPGAGHRGRAGAGGGS